MASRESSVLAAQCSREVRSGHTDVDFACRSHCCITTTMESHTEAQASGRYRRAGQHAGPYTASRISGTSVASFSHSMHRGFTVGKNKANKGIQQGAIHKQPDQHGDKTRERQAE